MDSSPYRTTPDPAAKDARETYVPDGDLLGAFGVLWLVSLVQVAHSVVRHQPFDGELTVVLLIFILLPVLMKDPVRDLARCLLHGFRRR